MHNLAVLHVELTEDILRWDLTNWTLGGACPLIDDVQRPVAQAPGVRNQIRYPGAAACDHPLHQVNKHAVRISDGMR